MVGSNISKFYELSMHERQSYLARFAGLSPSELKLLKGFAPLNRKTADLMIENVVGCYPLPLGVATHFLINGRDYLVPMAIEEPSVVAAASYAAKLARKSGGFKVRVGKQMMFGTVYLFGVSKLERALSKIRRHKRELLAHANAQDPILTKLGGGAKDLKCGVLVLPSGKSCLRVELHVDVRDAMGANAVNSMCEAIAPKLEALVQGETRMAILSNLATMRMARARAVWKKNLIGKRTPQAIVDAYEIACVDPYRAATHNKGIMNGIDAVLIATGNDFRAVEAGIHAYAAFNKQYGPITRYYVNKNGDLVGELEAPLQLGTVGGCTRVHPMAKVSLKLLGVKSAAELACVVAAVGLAQNFAALRALVTEGIQRGHMKLHAKNLAIQAGASEQEAVKVAEIMVGRGRVTMGDAASILAEIRRVEAR
jgi:hydroxymethylglutaryl-CoA reductase